jgi:hypothetical protein
MRLYGPNPPTLDALRGTNIELILDVPNSDLQQLADPSAATRWVQTNIQAYGNVRFRYISVGNEVDPATGTSQFTRFVLPAMQNVHNAIVAAGLQNQIRVSTAIYDGMLTNTFPPSASTYADNKRSFIEPIIRFLVQNNLPLLANVYPYFAYSGSTQIDLSYALSNTRNPVVVTDPDRNLQYRTLFSAMVDTHYAALEKVGASNVEVVVSESGWPSEGGNRGPSVENSRNYYRNLINSVRERRGTPRRPNTVIEAYLFAMFDENNKDGFETERHFGLFTPSQQSKYQISF